MLHVRACVCVRFCVQCKSLNDVHRNGLYVATVVTLTGETYINVNGRWWQFYDFKIAVPIQVLMKSGPMLSI